MMGKLAVVPVGDTETIPYHLRNAFPGAPATACRVPAMDVGCGLSTRGHWDDPVICNEWKGGCWHCMMVRHKVRYGERFHVNTKIHHFWGLLPSDINFLYYCHLDLTVT